jgi:predicted nucleic acid-binding protein
VQAILDTSVFIAHEQGRALGELPDEVAISVVTLSELRYGVLAADGHEQLARRLSTLETARQIVAHGAAVCAQDADFDAAAGAGLVEVVQV